MVNSKSNFISDPYRNIKNIHTFKARMDGNQEYPSEVETKAAGQCDIVYNSKTRELLYYIDFKGLTSSETASHFHIGGSKQKGEIAIPIPVGNPKMGALTLTEEQEELLFVGKMFFNIHTEQNPEGEIRGQIFPTSQCENDEYLCLIVAKKKDKKSKKNKKKWTSYDKKSKSGLSEKDKLFIIESINGMNDVSEVFYDNTIMGIKAKIMKITKIGSVETMEVRMGDDEDLYPRHMYFDISYDGNGGISSVRMWDSYVPAKHISDLISFLKSLGK